MTIKLLAKLNDDDFVILAFLINASFIVNRGSEQFNHPQSLYVNYFNMK